jgi:hypothetical protein
LPPKEDIEIPPSKGGFSVSGRFKTEPLPEFAKGNFRSRQALF